MTNKPSRPPSAAALALASFALTAAVLAGPQVLHRAAPAEASVLAALHAR